VLTNKMLNAVDWRHLPKHTLDLVLFMESWGSQT